MAIQISEKHGLGVWNKKHTSFLTNLNFIAFPRQEKQLIFESPESFFLG